MAKMMIMLLFGAASAYQGGGDQAYNTEDEHLSHGGPGGSGPADESVTGTSPEPSNRWPTASASYQGGGEQTYHTDDEHLGHGAAVGYGPAVGGAWVREEWHQRSCIEGRPRPAEPCSRIVRRLAATGR